MAGNGDITVASPHHLYVVQAAQFLFSSTCGSEAVAAQPQEIPAQSVIAACVSLAGELNANVFLGLPSDTAMAVAAKFAGFAIPFESSDMGDAVGELTNMLAGKVKALLDAKGIQANISLPCIMRDDSLPPLYRQSPGSLTTFQTPLGLLWAGLFDIASLAA